MGFLCCCSKSKVLRIVESSGREAGRLPLFLRTQTRAGSRTVSSQSGSTRSCANLGRGLRGNLRRALPVVSVASQGLGGGVGLGLGVGRGLGEGVGLGVAVGVGVGVAVDVGVGVTLGVGVGPPVTSRNAALIGPQVWKPWKSLTPRPCTKITWRPTDRLAVLMVASTGTVVELNVPFIGMAVPPAQGGVSMEYCS